MSASAFVTGATHVGLTKLVVVALHGTGVVQGDDLGFCFSAVMIFLAAMTSTSWSRSIVSTLVNLMRLQRLLNL
jgi:hypothetical protein